MTIWWMQTERRVAANTQTKPTNQVIVLCQNLTVNTMAWLVRILVLFIFINIVYFMPSVLCHCWLGGRKGIHPVKNGGMVEVGTV